jgi:hypothetical protein
VIERTFVQALAAEFSGIGVVIYRGKVERFALSPLVQDSVLSAPLKGDGEIAKFLISISRYSDPRHDGFHFVEEAAGLTHVSQLVSPLIRPDHAPSVFNVGARYRSAELISMMDTVSGVLVVEKNGRVLQFRHGRLGKEKP